MTCDISGSPTRAEHARWRVLSVGARHPEQWKTTKDGRTRIWDSERAASQGKREGEMSAGPSLSPHNAERGLAVWLCLRVIVLSSALSSVALTYHYVTSVFLSF